MGRIAGAFAPAISINAIPLRGDFVGEYTVTTTRTDKNGIETTEVEKRHVHIFRGEDGQLCTIFPKVTKLRDCLTVRINNDKYKAVGGRAEQITNGSEVLRNGIALISIEVTRDKAIKYQSEQCFFDVKCEPRYAECDGKQIDLDGQYYFGHFEPMKNGNYMASIIQR